jgi:hypothetical protein
MRLVMLLAVLVVASACKQRQAPTSEALSNPYGAQAAVTLTPVDEYPDAYGRWESECEPAAAISGAPAQSNRYVQALTREGFLYGANTVFDDDACRTPRVTIYSKSKLTFSAVATSDPRVQDVARGFMVAETQLLGRTRVIKPSEIMPDAMQVPCAQRQDYAAALGFVIPADAVCLILPLNQVQLEMSKKVVPFGLSVTGDRMRRDHLDVAAATRDPSSRAGCVPNLDKVAFTDWLAMNLEETLKLEDAGAPLPGRDGWCWEWTRLP